MIIFNLLTEAIEVVFYGVLSAVALMALLYGVLKLMSDGIVRSIPFYLTGVVLFPLLAIQFSLLIGAMQVRSSTDAVEMTVNQMVEGMYGTLGANDSQQLLDELMEEMPLLGVYVNTADFSGNTYEEVGSAVSETIHEYLSWYALRRLLWICGFVVVGCFIAMMYDKGPGTRTDRRSGRQRQSSGRSVRNERRPRRSR